MNHVLLLLAVAAAAEKPFCDIQTIFPRDGKTVHRIPSVVTAPDGTILAFADRRKGGRADWGIDTDVVLRRSRDGGTTWLKPQVLASEKGVCMHGGPALVERKSGRVFKFYRYRPNAIRRPEDVAKHFEKWVRRGYANLVIHSDDAGETWSKPARMRYEHPEKYRVGNGGHGVQLPSGRLLVNGGSHKGVDGPASFLFYSDDGGTTWQHGGCGRREGVVVEAATVVLSNGNVMVNHRTRGPRRRVTIYGEGGTTVLRTYVDRNLPEPFCHASLARYAPPADGGPRGILFANPPRAGTGTYDAKNRADITVRFSPDEGASWPVFRTLRPGPAGYSDLATLDDGTILCVFENGDRAYNERISAARFNLPWLRGGARIADVRKIWDRAPHNAFTDLCRFRGRWYVTFREAPRHGVPKPSETGGRIRVIVSDTGDEWRAAALLDRGRKEDLRDPKLSVTPAGTLMVLCAAAPQASPGERQPLVFLSKNGTDWGEAAEVGEHNFWLWRVTWHEGTAYGAGYSRAGGRHVRLYRSKDGLDYAVLVPRLQDEGFPNESSIIFLPDETALCLLRRDGGSNNTALLGTAAPPYTKWRWQDLGVRLGGPNLIRLPDGRIVVAARRYTPRTRTALLWLDPDNGRLKECLALPSGGDTSYAGLVLHDGLLWVSYYSSHEGTTAIYLARVQLSGMGGID